jgi:L,D-transpeptidase-like protein
VAAFVPGGSARAQQGTAPAAARADADSARGLRIVISLADRRLWTIVDDDTLLATTIAVASGASLEYQGRRWTFATPRGRRVVVHKDSLPVWVPPDWHYYEVARSLHLMVRPLVVGAPVFLDDGRRLEIRAASVGLVGADSVFAPLPVGEEIIFDGFLFMPPLGTAQRRIEGELGWYRLDLGEGIAMHGTPYAESIGRAATHGCFRLRDEDITWLYQVVPIGTRVYIY